MEGFDVAPRPEGGWTVLDVAGDVDVYSAPRLERVLSRKVEQGASRIVLNLEKVAFLDSSGLAVMIGGARRARERRGNLVLAGPRAQVERILRITDLDKVLPIYETVEEALREAPEAVPQGGDPGGDPPRQGGWNAG